jgi:hypothetical protein
MSNTAATITGASQAVCTPSPCVAGTVTNYTLNNISNDDGTTSQRTFAVYRPGHLGSSPNNLAPAIVVFYGSGSCNYAVDGRFQSLAASERNIVVTMEVPCTRNAKNWDKKNVNSATTATPNDEPYVTAVVNAITTCPASGAGPDQCADPRRLYAVGGSSGGNMAADVMCDQTNSVSFRGYQIDSSSLQLYGTQPNCPSTNRNYFVMMVLSNTGLDAGFYNNTSLNSHLDVPAFANWAGQRLGCTTKRVDDVIGSPAATNPRYRYFGPCGFANSGSAAVETLGVINGGHQWGCQDSDPGAPNVSKNCPGLSPVPGLDAQGRPKTSGLFVEREFETFLDQSVSGGGLTPTPIPTSTSHPTSVPTPMTSPTTAMLDLSYANRGQSYTVKTGTTIHLRLARTPNLSNWTLPIAKDQPSQLLRVDAKQTGDGGVEATFVARAPDSNKIIIESWADGHTKSSTVDFGVAITIAAGPSSTPTPTPTPTATPRPTSTPTSTPAPNSIRYFIASSPWNTPVKSTGALAGITQATVNQSVWTHTVYHVNSNTPLVPVAVPSSWGWPAGPIQAPVPVGAHATNDSDAEIVIVNDTTGQTIDFWGFANSNGKYSARSYGESNIYTANGFGTVGNHNLGAGTTAIGASGLGGLIVGSDLSGASINHAIGLELSVSYMKAGWVAPAINSDVKAGSGQLQEGDRLAIPAGTPKPSNLSPEGSKLWDALVKYGAIVNNQCCTPGWSAFQMDPLSTTAAQASALRSDTSAIVRALAMAS